MKTTLPVIAAGLIGFAAAAPAAELKLGTAAVPINPPAGIGLAGYYHERGNDGVLDDIAAKAVVLDDGTTRAAIVVCDLISMPNWIVAQARRQVEMRTGIPGSNVLIAATHTHTAPVLYREWSRDNSDGGSKPIARTYSESLPGLIADAVAAANGNRQAVRVAVAKEHEAQLAKNRRFWMRDGTVGWNPGKLNPRIIREAGPIDPEVGVFYAESAAEKPSPVLTFVNYAMHPDTTGGTRISADYPGALARALALHKGPEMFTLFANGTCGNINHIDVRSSAPQSSAAEAARLGGILAAAVFKAYPRLNRLTNAGPLRVRSEVVALPLPEVTESQMETARFDVRTARDSEPGGFMKLVRAHRVLDIASREGKPIEVEMQVITLGRDVAWVSWPGEIFVELGLSVKAGSPFAHTYNVELANGTIGYIPNKPAYSEGAYEVESARVAAGAGEILASTALRLLSGLANDATPPAEGNGDLIRRYFDRWANHGDERAADALIATDVVLRHPHVTVSGLESYKQSMAAFHAAFPDRRFALEDVIAQSDKVLARWVLTGTQQGDLQGHPASGKSMRVEGMSLFRIVGGKIQEIWVNQDRLGMQQQLGWLAASTTAGAAAGATPGTAPRPGSRRVADEPLFFTGDTKTNAVAQLLWIPDAPPELGSSDGSRAYEAGRDFTWQPGSRRITLTPDSRIPFKPTDQMYPPPQSPNAYRFRRDNTNQWMFFGPGRLMHDLQSFARYSTTDPWQPPASGAAPDSQLGALRTRLRERKPVKLVVLGDSISTGADASALANVAPRQPGYPDLIARGLTERFGAPVTLTNLSVGGMDSKWGTTRVPSVIAESPDLLVVAFGMNDASGRRKPEEFARLTRDIFEPVRAARPDCAVLLVSSMTANAEWAFAAPEIYPKYAEALSTLTGPGVAFVDVHAVWSAISARKKHLDLSGNGLNHPNDYGHRLYAQTILAVIGGAKESGP